jgi:hypothetical protein
MTTVVLAGLGVLVLALGALAVVSYRRHSRKARAKSAAAMATLLAEAEAIAAGRPEASASGSSAENQAPPVSSRLPSPITRDPVQEAYERGYRTGFSDGRAAAQFDAGQPEA